MGTIEEREYREIESLLIRFYQKYSDKYEEINVFINKDALKVDFKKNPTDKSEVI